MMDLTDRHYRYFARCLTRHAWLYTEMITTHALIHGDHAKLLTYHPAEHPIALQLGGSDPQALAQCAKMAEDYGYDEVNLNVGCPSDRVQSGRFGVSLMAEPDLVTDCVASMQAATTLPITVKHRLGIDDLDSDEQLHHFVATVAASGCTTFIVHARKAWLKGLSPKENRDIPPLQYPRVHQLKQAFPQLEIIINGGLMDLSQARPHLEQVDGVMLGREAYSNPYLLAEVDSQFYADSHPIPSRQQVIQTCMPYIEQQMQQGVAFKHISRHLLGIFQGQPGARRWRRYLSEHAHLADAGLKTLESALQQRLPSAC